MADYIYLLEHRLLPAQRDALRRVAELARSKGLTVFLVGGAVRDLTSGSPVRDLDVVIQGNALKLRKDLERIGAVISGEHDALQSLYVRFPGSVRMEVGSALEVTYPKPARPAARPAGIQQDLRRRDFTANAMALSLNEGSYGLLMDPLNGVADIENRELRLISNYGFIEEPVRLIRAARLMARLGWRLEEKTAARYKTAIEENSITGLSDFHRGYETQEIFHEEDPMRVLERLEADGWLTALAPAWTSAKVNVAELERLREVQIRLQVQGIQPDGATVSFPLLTAKLSANEINALKASFPRQGFVAEIDGLDAEAKQLAAQLTGKQTALPSETWKLLHRASAEAVLSVAFSSRNAALQAKLKSFETEWPQARQKIPYQLMTEMRIVPELPGYGELTEKLFFELMDGNLATPEAMRAYLEPFSPPAPPPPISLRKARVGKKEAKSVKSKAKKSESASAADAEPRDRSARTEAPAGPVEPAVKAAAEKVAPVKMPVKTPVKSSHTPVAPAKADREQPASTRSATPAKTSATKKTAGNATAAKSMADRATAMKGSAKKPAGKQIPAQAAMAKSVPAKSLAAKGSPGTSSPNKAAPAKVASANGKPAAPVKPANVAPRTATKAAAKRTAKSAAKTAKKAPTLAPVKNKATAKTATPAKKVAGKALKPAAQKPAKKSTPAKGARRR